VTDSQPTLGRRLRRLRLAKGLTQREVAAPQYTHAYISTIEAGRRQPSPAALHHFAERLSVDVDDLMSGRPSGVIQELDAALLDARIAASDGRLAEAEAILSSSMRRARRYGVHMAEARGHEIRGLISERSGRPEAALDEYERAEALVHTEHPARRVDAVAGKARCLQALGDVRHAIFLLESLRSLMPSERDDVEARAHISAALLNAYLDAGLVRSAEAAAQDLEALLPRLGDHVRRGQVYLYLARFEAARGNARDADRLLAASAGAYEESRLRTETGYSHLARGYVLSREGKLARAEKELEHARRIFEQTRNDKELANTLIERARVARMRGRADEAVALLEGVIGRFGDRDTELLGWAHREYGLVFADRDHVLAEKHLRVALGLFDRGEERIEAASTYRMLGDVLRAAGEHEAAFDAYAAGIRRVPTSRL
jgi:tetratricopeptide (TPR) repeat protein